MPNKEKHPQASTPARQRNKISPARSAAFRILLDLSRSASAHSDDLLRSAPVNALSTQDRKLCTALTMGTLRWQLVLDAQIAPLLQHKTKLDDPVRVALRLAAFQLLFMDRIPAHAAISDSVELTKRARHRYASGLVNAVLRKVAEAARQTCNATQAHPAWLLQRWAAFLPDESIASICQYDQSPPPATIRLVAPGAEAALVAQGIQLEQGCLLAAARRVLAGDVAETIVIRQGHARMQDEGSQLVAELLRGSAQQPLSILDCCAAPGGKTTILAERYPDSRVLARDISTARVARMRELFDLQAHLSRIEIHVADATAPAPDEHFDRILCDVPCSGTGTLARNPEIKLRLQPEDLARQQARQIAILQCALRQLSSGGELVYSTCSLEPEENELVIQAVLCSEAGIHIKPIQRRIDELLQEGTIHAEGAALLRNHGVSGDFLRTIPGRIPVDGFFAALLVRD